MQMYNEYDKNKTGTNFTISARNSMILNSSYFQINKIKSKFHFILDLFYFKKQFFIILYVSFN